MVQWAILTSTLMLSVTQLLFKLSLDCFFFGSIQIPTVHYYLINLGIPFKYYVMLSKKRPLQTQISLWN